MVSFLQPSTAVDGTTITSTNGTLSVTAPTGFTAQVQAVFGGTRFYNLQGFGYNANAPTSSGDPTEANVKTALAAAATLRSLELIVVSAGNAGNNVFTVRKNGVDTALTITVNGNAAPGTKTNVAATVACVAGDVLTLSGTTAGATGALYGLHLT